MRKLNRKWQMLLYACSGFGVNLLNLMMGSYLCSALLIGGFRGDAILYQTYNGSNLVVAGVWAAFVLIAKIIDGVIDIPMASFTDRLQSRFGRRRPSIVIGMIPMIAAYLLFLVIPHPQGESIWNTIYYGVILCVFYSFYTLTMVTYYATFTEIVETEDERVFMSNVKSVCDIFYFILGYVVVRAMLNSMNVRPVALIVLPLVLTMTIPLFMIKEPSTKGKVVLDNGTRTVNLVESLKYTFKNRAFVLWMIVIFFMNFGVNLFLGGINEYFSFTGLNMIFIMACSFAPVPFTLILYNKIIKKKGFGFAFRYVLLTYGLGMVCMFFVGLIPASMNTLKTVLSIVSGIICSFAVGALFAVAYSVPSQLAADEEQETGVSHSAMYFAIQGVFSGVATGLAQGVVLVALKKASEGRTGLAAMSFMTLICGLGMLVSFICTFFLPRQITHIGLPDKNEPEE
ncbi:MAG: MFS transporter [Clostridia bacterium]|nr:MFS transporter [Clostridia bacterium]